MKDQLRLFPLVAALPAALLLTAARASVAVWRHTGGIARRVERLERARLHEHR